MCTSKNYTLSKPEIETAARTLLRLQLVTHGNWVAPVSQRLHELQPDRARFSGRLQLYPHPQLKLKIQILKVIKTLQQVAIPVEVVPKCSEQGIKFTVSTRNKEQNRFLQNWFLLISGLEDVTRVKGWHYWYHLSAENCLSLSSLWAWHLLLTFS